MGGVTHLSYAVLRHYLRTTLRVLGRQASFSVINLVGLSVGIAAAFLLLLFVRNEVTFDRAHEKADRIYRAWLLEDYGEDQIHFNTTTPVRLAGDLEAGIPEVEAAVRFDPFNTTVRRDEVSHNESIYMVDVDFLDVFDFALVSGSRTSLFTDPDNIILTETSATRYFAQETAVGETLTLEFNGQPRTFTVSGVLADPPENSSLQFELLVPYTIEEWFYSDRLRQAFFNVSPETYVLLREGAQLAEVEAKMPALFDGLVGDRVEPGQYQVGLQPLLDIHTNPSMPQGFSTVISPVYVRILTALAVLILAIASINFVTLSISRSLARAKEIGVRKVIGAGRSQLVAQYWGEALLLTAVSLALGLILARLALPAFNSLAQRELSLAITPGIVALVVGVFAAVGLLAGMYPALVLSRFSPIEAFRGKVAGSAGRSTVRKALVVAQFALSILMVASTLAIGNQLDFLQEKDLGFDRESVVSIPTVATTAEGKEIADRLRFRLSGRSDVISLTAAAMLFDQNGWGRIGYTAADGTYKRHFANVVDHDFVRTMGLRLAQGRDFARDQPGDAERAIIVNQAFAAAHGWTTPLTEQIPGQFDQHEIIGVVEDFHFQSLHTEIQPAMFALESNVAFSGAQDFDYGGSFAPDIAIRIAGTNVPETLAAVESAWTEAAPEMPFTYRFVDDAIAAQYRQEARLARMINIGALLSIFIAGLGLFGLASLAVARRSKEIGLRKVLGASVPGIVRLFTAEFSTLVIVAFFLATPAAWYGLSWWVEGFAYRAPIGPAPFVAALLAALAVMALAVSAQAVRAGVANPVDALRDE